MATIPQDREAISDADDAYIGKLCIVAGNHLAEASDEVNRAQVNDNDDYLLSALGHLAAVEALIVKVRAAIMANVLPSEDRLRS